MTDARGQQATPTALGLESLFAACNLEFRRRRERLGPCEAEVARAVTNVLEWKAYLPKACVAAMIKDGWQWST